MSGRDWIADPTVIGGAAPDELFEAVRQRRTMSPSLTVAYERWSVSFAESITRALPDVAPELIAVVAMNVLGRLAGVAHQLRGAGAESDELVHGMNVAALAALRLWDGV